ncbi:MAG: hypothetical protein U0V70_03160 [Terriglobia bacterium]
MHNSQAAPGNNPDAIPLYRPFVPVVIRAPRTGHGRKRTGPGILHDDGSTIEHEAILEEPDIAAHVIGPGMRKFPRPFIAFWETPSRRTGVQGADGRGFISAAFANGKPHLMQAGAASETWALHSGQLMRAMQNPLDELFF